MSGSCIGRCCVITSLYPFIDSRAAVVPPEFTPPGLGLAGLFAAGTSGPGSILAWRRALGKGGLLIQP